ncbi:MAG: Prepilin-type cleavage/methylation protein [Cyanobacteria bacterium RYN_339]|nr:Prepilin-type cleavage/methylation protein [Cyanobacteria bacterium RYN_339]
MSPLPLLPVTPPRPVPAPWGGTSVLVAACGLGIFANLMGLRVMDPDAASTGTISSISLIICIVGSCVMFLLTPALLLAEAFLGGRQIATSYTSRLGQVIAWGFLFFVAATVAAPMPMPSSKARNAGVQANVNTVRMGLEQYATDHNGKYPPVNRWQQVLCAKGTGYLPGDQMPRSPWSKQPQTALLRIEGLGLPGAAAIAAGKPLPQTQTKVGLGRVAVEGPDHAQDYGAILYDMDPKTDTYVLYGIGRNNKEAIVAADVSNQ